MLQAKAQIVAGLAVFQRLHEDVVRAGVDGDLQPLDVDLVLVGVRRWTGGSHHVAVRVLQRDLQLDGLVARPQAQRVAVVGGEGVVVDPVTVGAVQGLVVEELAALIRGLRAQRYRAVAGAVRVRFLGQRRQGVGQCDDCRQHEKGRNRYAYYQADVPNAHARHGLLHLPYRPARRRTNATFPKERLASGPVCIYGFRLINL